MYLWKIRPLLAALAENRISEKVGMHYFLALTLIGTLSTYLSLWLGAVRSWLFFFEIVAVSAIAVFGCLKAFSANGGDLGNAFVLRATCIAVPSGVRVFFLSVLFTVFMYFGYDRIFTHEYFGDPLRAYMLISYTVFIGLSIYFFGGKDTSLAGFRHGNHQQIALGRV